MAPLPVPLHLPLTPMRLIPHCFQMYQVADLALLLGLTEAQISDMALRRPPMLLDDDVK